MELSDVLGMSMQEVESILGTPSRTHVLNIGTEMLTSWIYHTDAEPMCIWFDGQDRVKMASSNCTADTVVEIAAAS